MNSKKKKLKGDARIEFRQKLFEHWQERMLSRFQAAGTLAEWEDFNNTAKAKLVYRETADDLWYARYWRGQLVYFVKHGSYGVGTVYTEDMFERKYGRFVRNTHLTISHTPAELLKALVKEDKTLAIISNDVDAVVRQVMKDKGYIK